MQLVSVAFGVTTVLLVLLTAFRLDALEAASASVDQDGIVWEQPAQIIPQFPEPISDATWHFDFDEAENLLGSLRFTPDNRIVLDEATTIVMKRLHHWQKGPDNPHADPVRVQFLMSKFFPDSACYQSFSDLWRRFVAFKDAERQQADLPALQTQFFTVDEIAGLFGRQNRLAAYLSARSGIIEKTELTEAQREQALQALALEHRAEPDTKKAVKNGPCS